MKKKILITGTNGYIGKSLMNWLMSEPNKYKVDFLSVRDDSWKQKQFDRYDAIFHAAGIVHIKETKENKSLYFKVNRDLTYEIAKKAKAEGIKHFIFLSTMNVYGLNKGIINSDTPLEPSSAYGKSKLEAEKLINNLQSSTFNVSIIRPPLVYGKGCKGNYNRLAQFALKTPVFPKTNNKRSMIYIDNLSEFIKNIIDNSSNGVFFPQNSEYVSSSEMISQIASSHKRKVYIIPLFSVILKKLNLNVTNKVFGDLYYKKELSEYKERYNVFSFGESIKITEDVKIGED